MMVMAVWSARDFTIFAKATASNVLARFAPALYVRLTRQTGRGRDDIDAEAIADYFFRCVDDYRQQLGLDDDGLQNLLRGTRVLEYGPGDVLGVALILYAYGAESVRCVDRFPLERTTERNLAVYERILTRLSGEALQRAGSAFRTSLKPESGFRPECVSYSVTPDGLARGEHAYDLIISRAVLEHVNCLEKTIGDVRASLKPDGVSVHNVDLKSHNLDRIQPFDFLAWPEWAYRLMYSHKGFPNRHRIDRYRHACESAALRIITLAPTGLLSLEDVVLLQPRLARPFRRLSAEGLRWMGFWIVLRPGTKRELPPT
ncbi:MAG: methyltransferase domain-containing protein [Rhizobacter sp.]|nr:methyltransferase domain-containing protein [Rhizobacter sp.]